MAMRETPRSLRAYFLIVGVLGLLSAAANAKNAQGVPLVLALAAVTGVVALGYLWFGATLPRELARGARGVRLFLIASAVVSVAINGALAAWIASALAVEAVPTTIWAALVLVPLITIYLLVNVKRLAAGVAASAPAVFD